MNTKILTAIALALILSAPMAFAQQRQQQPRNECQTTHDQCHQPIPSQPNVGKDRGAPKVGASAARGRPFEQAPNSRFSPPPRGQEYRVMNDNLVLVDQNTLQIVTVLGLLGALTR